jgi:LysR family nitrogen assimilation transcriptional regulator
MDIRQLRYFVGVLEAKSLSKASTLLRVAQPALSTQMRNLERELGVKLLDRHARGIAPTKAGEHLAQHVYQLLRQVDCMRLDLSSYATAPGGHVRMCIARSIPRIVTTAIAQRCRREFPDVQLTVLESWRQQLQADRLTADLALIFHPEQVGIASVSEPLVQDELVLVCSANESQVLPPEIDLGRAFQQQLILPSRPHYLRLFVESAALSAGHELKIACEVDSLEVTKELVARGVANAILPIACVRDDVRKEKLRYVRIGDPRFQRILYMVRSRQPRSVMIDLICREIRAVIFECADQETLGWRRIHLMEPMSSDELHEHQSPDFSVHGTIKSPVASSHLGNHS